jgi:CRISPR-associated protein Cas2
LEPRTGVFLGNPSARIRDELWKKTVQKIKDNGTAIQIWSDQNPQGFSYRQWGNLDRKFIELEGVALIQIDRTGIKPSEN